MAVTIKSLVRRLFGPAADQAVTEQQTDQAEQRSMVGQLKREFAEHPSKGLTPARLYQILESAEQGDIKAQHELYADMEEKDPQIQSDLGKRRLAAAELEWQIVPPDGANRAERKAADQAAEAFSGLEVEDLIIELGDGIGHGWVNLELPWDREGDTRVIEQPIHRPHGWFRLDPEDQNRLRLRDGSAFGAELWPLGWIEHRHKAKSGYLSRLGLMRTLAWPYLFQNYALGDLAELLELLGIPARLGRYPANATDKEKATLLKAVTSLGHSAAGIIPREMEIEYLDAANSTQDLYSVMLEWCERSKSKAILGGTLTTGTDAGAGAYALGEVHERGLQSLVSSDCRQHAGSIRRYILWPMAAMNFGITDRRRAPRFYIDTGEAEDFKLLAETLPIFVEMGARISQRWFHDKTKIPEAGKGEPVLGPAAKAPAAPPETAALKGETKPTDPAEQSLDTLQPPDPTALQRQAEALLAPILGEGAAPAALMAAAAEGEEALLAHLAGLYPQMDGAELEEQLAKMIFISELWGQIQADQEAET